MVACPYGVRYFNWETPEWPGSFAEYLNPTVPIRPAGVVEKCTFCVHRIDRLKHDLAKNDVAETIAKNAREGSLEDRASKAVDVVMRRLYEKGDEVNEAEPADKWEDFDFRELRYLPSCTRSCPAKAIIFGDLDDPNSLVSQLAKSHRAVRLFEELGTEPKVIYLTGGS